MSYLDVVMALGHRFSGVSIDYRRTATEWPMPVRVRLVTSKRWRQAYAVPVYGMTVEEACKALVGRVAELDQDDALCKISHVYTREQFDADHERIVTRICQKHGIPDDEVPELIAEHRYVHDEEDIEDEYIQIMAMARHAGWVK